MSKIYDVCIIGAGPAGIFAALELASDYNVLVLELGQCFSKRHYCKVLNNFSCDGCNGRCSVISGFGGSFCSKSGGILSVYPAGSSLIQYYDSKDELLSDYFKALKMWEKYSVDNLVFEGLTDREQILYFGRKVNDFGGIYKHYNGYRLSKDNLDNTVQKLEDIVKEKATLKFESEVINTSNHNDQWDIECSNGVTYQAKTLLFATGRKGNSITSENIKKLGVAYKKTGIDIGVRIELSGNKIDELSKFHPDIKIKFNLNGEEVRTFCFCPQGRIIHFNQDSLNRTINMDFLEGYIDTNNLSDRTNISFLHRINFDKEVDVWEFQRRFEENYDLFGGKIIAQRFNDVGKNVFSPLPKNTTLNDYLIGSVFSIIPEKSMYVLLDAINKFDKLMDGRVLDSETVIVAPEIGNFWPEIKTDKSFQLNLKGIFFAGDALGFIRGALQACVTGIKASGAITKYLNERKKYG